MSNVFSKREILKKSFEVTKKNIWFLVGITAIFLGVNLLLGMISGFLGDFGFIISLLGWAVQILVTLGFVIISLKLVRGEDAQVGDLFKPTHKIISGLGASLLITLVNFLVMAGGIGALALMYGSRFDQLTFLGFPSMVELLPGILLVIVLVALLVWINIVFFFFSYSIVDEDTRAIESLKRSKELTNGSRWNIFLLQLTMGLIVGAVILFLVLANILANILGLVDEVTLVIMIVIGVILIIGIFVIIPFSMIAMAHVFLKLKGNILPVVEPAPHDISVREDVAPTLSEEEHKEAVYKI